MSAPFVRNRFSREAVRLMCAATADDPSQTKQSFKDECDINFIMGKYAKGQIVDHLAKYEGDYGIAPTGDLHEMMNIVTRANEMFADLESEVRLRFGNSPVAFLQFAQDPANLPEMRRMGLAKPDPAIAPIGAPAPSGAAGTAAGTVAT